MKLKKRFSLVLLQITNLINFYFFGFELKTKAFQFELLNRRLNFYFFAFVLETRS